VDEKNLFIPEQIETQCYLESMSEFLLSGMNTNGRPLILGKTPYVYTVLGLQPYPLYIKRAVIKKIREKHSIPHSLIDNINKLLYDPLIICKSISKTGASGSIIAILKEKDGNNRPIIAVITPKNANKFNEISSVYGIDEFEKFLNENLRKKSILYVEKEEALKDIQHPELHDFEENIFKSNNILLTKENVVKRYFLDSPANT
jgi:hypothetical protein